MIWGCLVASGGWAQTPANDTTALPRIAEQSRALEALDSLAGQEKNLNFYGQIKQRLTQRKTGRAVYRAVFREPGRVKGDPPVRPLPKASQLYGKLEGRVVRHIEVRQLPVFGPSVNDTLRPAPGWVGRTGNRLHISTRARVIQRNLLFRSGDPLNLTLLRDSERLLRELPYLLDARLVPIATEHPDSVDLVVITQDVWSIAPEVGSVGLGGGRFALRDRNLLGLGHELEQGVRIGRRPGQGLGYLSRYRIPTIGRTLISAELAYWQDWEQMYGGLRLQRPFYTPAIRYAGGLEVSQQRLALRLRPGNDSGAVVSGAFQLADAWGARAFRFRVGSPGFRERARLVLAGRVRGVKYYEGPLTEAVREPLFQDRLATLATLTFSDRGYYRDVLIYGFGRTEDVPYGTLVSLTGGWETTPYRRRPYAAFRVANGEYHEGLGYLFGDLEAGSFFENQEGVRSALRLQLNYFSPLTVIRRYQWRQFVRISGLLGHARDPHEWVSFNRQAGIRGLRGGEIWGRQRLVVNFETVLFTPYNFLGFRLTTFAFSDFALLGGGVQSVWRGPLYQGYGLGLRWRNEHLAFSTFQLRLGFYPNAPPEFVRWRTDMDGLPQFRFDDLAAEAPEFIFYQ